MGKPEILLVLFFSLLWSDTLPAQEMWTRFLGGNQVENIAFQGKDIWCATFGGGAVRWSAENGSYQQYTDMDGLGSNDIREIIVLSNGKVWARTAQGGICEYDGVRWSTVETESEIRALKISPDGTIWAARRDGLAQFDENTWKIVAHSYELPFSVITSFSFSPHGDLWCCDGEACIDSPCGHPGVARFDGKTWTVYKAKDGLTHDWVFYVTHDPNGNPWAVSPNGVARFDGDKWHGYPVEEYVDGWPGKELLVEKNGTAWLATNHGIIRFSGDTRTTYKTDDGSPSGKPLNNCILAIGPDDAVWAGTLSPEGGIFRFDGNQWISYTVLDGIGSNGIWDMKFDTEGALWVGTNNGLSCFRNGSWSTFRTQGPVSEVIHAIAIGKKDEVWFGTDSGISRYDFSGWTTFTEKDGLPFSRCDALEIDSDGTVWAGTSKGVARFKEKQWKMYTTEDGLPDNFVISLAASGGNIWAGCQYGGVAHFDGNTWTKYTNSDGFAGQYARSIVFDRNGGVWFGANTGLSRYENGKWQSFTLADGLPDQSILSMVVDSENRLWCSTQKYLVMYDGVTWANITMKNGLLKEWIGKLFLGPDDAVWFGAGDGNLHRIQDENITIPVQKSVGGVGGLAFASDGTLWIGCDLGALRYTSHQSAVYSKSEPARTDILSNSPNPFNPSTTIAFTLPRPGTVTLAVYDITGRKVADLARGFHSAGKHEVVWRAEGCASGVYFCVLKAGNAVETRKMLLMR